MWKVGFNMLDNLNLFSLLSYRKFKNKNAKYVWWFNIGVESIWRKRQDTILPQIVNTSNSRTVNRTEQLSLLLADDSDIVIQRENPPEIVWKENLEKLRFGMPEILVPEKKEKDEQYSISELILQDKKLIERLIQLKSQNSKAEAVLVPYAVTELEEEISRITGYRLFGAPSKITEWINSKISSRTLAEQMRLPVTEGYICRSVKEVRRAIEQLQTNSGINKFVVKEEYGASGKGSFIIDSKRSYELLLSLLQRKSNAGKKINLIVERWYDTLLDLNYQIYVDEKGSIYYLPPKQQFIKDGIYIGSEFPILDKLTDSQKQFYEECAFKIGQKLWEKGYWGIASIDSIITYDGMIYPIIEINGRFSLSTYISFIPEMLGKDKLYRTKYYNIKSDVTLNEIWSAIRGLRYSRNKGEGVLIYSFVQRKTGLSEGRLFSLFVAYEGKQLDILEKRMGRIMNDYLRR